MALSGSFTGITNSSLITPKIVWSGVHSVSGNYTDVTATLSYSRTNSGYTTYGTWSGSITINGTKTSGSKYVEITYNSNTVTLTATTRVYHNSDGTKSITISASGAISGTSLQSTTISATVTLTTIPRATTPTFSSSNVTMGNSVTINLSRASSSFTHSVKWEFGEQSGEMSNVATSTTWAVPVSLASEIPNATSGACTITTKTYSGSTLIGTTTATITLVVPDSVVPTISNVSITEATAGLAAKFGAFVQNKSTLSVAITASGAHESTISAYQTSIQSVSYKGASFTSGVITASGTISVITTVTDSRGRTAQTSKSITVLEYSPPEISAFSAWRITSAGVASDDGNRLAMQMKFAIASVGGKNDKTYSIKYRASSDTDFNKDPIASGTASTSYDDTQYFTSSPEISIDYAYVIRLEIADYFQTVAYEVQIPTAFTIMDFRNTGKGMAIGKVSEKDAFEVAMNSEFTGQVKIFAPASTEADSGFIRMYRADGTLAAFLATSDGGDGLNLHLYSGGAWSGVVKVTKDGAVVAKNLSYGTATTG